MTVYNIVSVKISVYLGVFEFITFVFLNLFVPEGLHIIKAGSHHNTESNHEDIYFLIRERPWAITIILARGIPETE